jgi:hypothetical protein
MPHLDWSISALSCCLFSRTFICVLSRELRDGISDLAAHRVVRLLAEAGKQLGADGFSLGFSEGEEQILGLACSGLAWFGGLAPEDDGRERSSLARV